MLEREVREDQRPVGLDGLGLTHELPVSRLLGEVAREALLDDEPRDRGRAETAKLLVEVRPRPEPDDLEQPPAGRSSSPTFRSSSMHTGSQVVRFRRRIDVADVLHALES
jgi:hypothetical protein